MTNETQQTSGTETSHIPFGAKLQSARESMNMDRKDAAAQLRLHEKYIDMMENDAFPQDMPAIFARGYIRAYGKLLQLSEDTIAEGLAPIQATTTHSTNTPLQTEFKLKPPAKKLDQATSRKYVMRGMTMVIVITMLWLVAAWWHNRATSPVIVEADTITINTTEPTATTPGTETAAPGTTAAQSAAPTVRIPLRPADEITATTKPATPKLNQAKLPSPVKRHASNTKKALPSPVSQDEDDYYID